MKDRPFTGLTAEIKVNNTVLAYVSGVDLTIEKTIIEILQFGATYREKVPAIKDWSASIDGTVALAAGNSQQKLLDAFETGEELTLGIFLNDFTYFEGKAFVENFNISGAPDDAMTLSSDLAGNGAVILYLPTAYSVSISSGVGGTCTPGGTQVVQAGTNLEITITPAIGYEIDKVFDNSVDVTTNVSDSKYTITGVAADHIVVITFKAIGSTTNYTVNISGGVGGLLGPSGVQTVAAGSDFSLTILPTSGYTVDTLLDNGIDMTASISSNIYTIEDIAEDHTIVVTFTT